MTTLGFIILMIPVAIVFYAGIRLAPVYLNYMKVVHTLEQVSTEVPNETASEGGIRYSCEKHFNIESVDFPDAKDLSIHRVNSVWQVEAKYDDQAPLFANIFILVSFDKVVQLKGGGGG
jgi:hypothetical protein